MELSQNPLPASARGSDVAAGGAALEVRAVEAPAAAARGAQLADLEECRLDRFEALVREAASAP